MNRFIPILFSISLLIVICAGCKKNTVSEDYTETSHPVTPDLSTQVNISVDGFITDENGNPATAASIKAGSVTVNTDEYGYFRINNTAFAKSAGFIEVTKPGYFTGFRTFLPKDGSQTFIRLQLIPKTIDGTIDATTGGNITLSNTASVTIPANAVVLAFNNTAYNGPINVSAHWLNPAEMATTQLIMPGDLRGIDVSGYLQTLTTFGMMVVELTSPSGELLQIANGQRASLSFPIPASLLSAAPASIPLWHFDESIGLWKEEGTATKNGSSYIGEVSHFSTWNCDVPNATVNFSMQVLDVALNPLSNVPVTITSSGAVNSTRMSYTNANGEIYDMVPANSNLVISFSSVCNSGNPVYTQNLLTSTSDVDLGSINFAPEPSQATFKGYVKKCNGEPVTNGYVIIASALSNKAVEIQNGDFDAAGIICPNSNASVIAFDRDAADQSAVQNYTIVSGVNDLDTLQACTSSQVESITYTLDGIPKTLSLPQHLFNANFDFVNNKTTIDAIDLLNGSVTVFSISFNGVDMPGSRVLNATINLDQAIYTFVSPGTATVSNYGLIGQFITLSSDNTYNILDVSSNTHTFSCTINVVRDM